MTSHGIRGAIGAAAALSLLASTVALADTIVADGDSMSAGSQTSINLGQVAAGDSRALDVNFVLTCVPGSHATPFSTISVDKLSVTKPDDGSADVSSTEVDVPENWPASSDCPDTATPVTSSNPSHIVVTAPSTAGPGREFVVIFVVSPTTGISSSTIVFSILMDVVAPAPDDTTPPDLSGVPDPMTVTTTGTSAVVSWPLPTATDDTDPDPVVACSPHSGSTFPLGTTPVTCTASDASGNTAAAMFDVTVVQVPQLVGSWGQPLDDAVPALVGRAGRTLPLKLTVAAAGDIQGPSDITAPVLMVAPLSACTADATAGPGRSAGSFSWQDGAWQLNLRTGSLDAGCWRLAAAVDGETVATAVIQLAADGQVSASLRRH